jgi:hypothetical protein
MQSTSQMSTKGQKRTSRLATSVAAFVQLDPTRSMLGSPVVFHSVFGLCCVRKTRWSIFPVAVRGIKLTTAAPIKYLNLA